MTDNNEEPSSSSEIESSSEFSDLIAEAPDLGFWQLTVNEAAALIATDQWFEGEIVADVPKADSYDPQDPELRQALSKHISSIEKRLTAAIDEGSIKATKIRRDHSDQLDTDKTLVHIDSINDWLEERGYQGGYCFNDYFKDEARIQEKVIDEIYRIRVMPKQGGLLLETKHNPDRAGISELRLAVKELMTQNVIWATDNLKLEQKLRRFEENHSKSAERPLSTRLLRTLLTIIAALCNKAGIKLNDRGAAARISELTEEIGASVSDDTVRKIISEIDDAVETRTK